jgi:hypothetical protein
VNGNKNCVDAIKTIKKKKNEGEKELKKNKILLSTFLFYQ